MSPELLPECETMGRVTTEARVENLKDLWDSDRGMIPDEKVRRVELTDALVDTGAATLTIPTRLVQALGLGKTREKKVLSIGGTGTIGIYEAVRLTIQGRDCVVEVMEGPDDISPLIGQVPLEMLDLVVDLQGRRLTGNPAHGGEQVLELL